MKKKLTLLLFGLIILLINPVHALEVKTHKAINEVIAKGTFNGFSLDTYLKTNLGIQQGIDEVVAQNTKIFKWLERGGEYEDVPVWYLPYLRSVNHFHNPITDQGYSGIWGSGFLSGVSSTQWALLPLGTQSPGGYYSWHDVRDYYYKALTSSTKTERDTYFAETFRGLGQLMHLIQDVSVPAHTRDDTHISYNYETWVINNVNKDNLSGYGEIFFNGIINTTDSFIETNQYNGTNPNIAVGNAIGLSEYTNANFFSEDTIFSDNFPYPAWSSTSEYEEVINSGTGEVRTYLKKISDGETVQHLAAGKWFYKYLPADYKRLGLKLDDNVYKDYASLLLPRAVGYSAGLIDYFFRGKIDFAIDDGDRADGVKGIRVSSLSNEDMDGTFSLYYDATDGNRYLLGSWTLLLSAQGTSPVLSFSFPENNIELHKYILIFRGRMGMEQGAVAGYIHGAGWREEWDAGLYDNHNWVYSENDLVGQNPNNGETINTVASGSLVKENIRYAGSDMARINETYIGVADEVINGTYYLGGYAIPYDFTDRFPIEVTPDTWLNLKIDAMSINEPIPAQSCVGTEWPTGAYQGINFYFRFGDGSTRTIVLTTSGHESFIWPTELIPLSLDYSVKIHELLVSLGGYTEPVYLDGINITQQMWNLCAPSSIEHRQFIEVDYIRVENR